MLVVFIKIHVYVGKQFTVYMQAMHSELEFIYSLNIYIHKLVYSGNINQII